MDKSRSSAEQGGRLVYLRDWVGHTVSALTTGQQNVAGKLTNIAFDEKRLMYLVIDDQVILNFDHVIEVRLNK